MDAAQILDGQLKHRGDIGSDRHVPGDGQSTASCSLNLGDNSVGHATIRPVVDRDRGAVESQTAGDPAADSARCPRDECDLTVKPTHRDARLDGAPLRLVWHDLPAVIVAAVGAHVVRAVRPAAVGAQHDGPGSQLVVLATLALSGMWSSSLRYCRHGVSFGVFN
jgi:hypothetical protein